MALLALSDLLFGARSAAAFTESSSQNSQQILNLSQSISKSIDLNENDLNLLDSAIHRALLAKDEGAKTQQPEDPQVAGGMVVQGSQPSINGKVAQPQPQPSGKPIINGTVLSQPDRSEQIRHRVRPDRR